MLLVHNHANEESKKGDDLNGMSPGTMCMGWCSVAKDIAKPK